MTTTTCIVALREGDVIYFGGDTLGICSESLRQWPRRDEKVFEKGEFLMGYSASYRTGQVLRYRFEPPPLQEDEDVPAYMCTRFIDALYEALEASRAVSVTPPVMLDARLLVAVRGRIFEIGPDFQVGELSCNYAAIGCGEELALGSLHTSARLPVRPEDRVRYALEAAEEFSAGVRGPFTIISRRYTS